MLQDVEPTRLLVLGTIRESGGHRARGAHRAARPPVSRPGLRAHRARRASTTPRPRARRRRRRAQRQRLVHPAPARGHRGQPVLHQGDAAQPGRRVGELEVERHAQPRPRPRGRQGADRHAARAARATPPRTCSRAASVVGREFRLEVLEALLDEPVERIISALEEADEAGLVREVADDADRFVFAHALVRETLYERQSASRRVRLHHRIAQALEDSARSRRPPSSPTTTSRAATWTARARPSTTAEQAAVAGVRGAGLRGGQGALRRRAGAPARRRAAALPAADRPRHRRRSDERPRRRRRVHGRGGDRHRASTSPTLLAARRARAASATTRTPARSTTRRSSCSSARSRPTATRRPAHRAAARAPGQRAALRRAAASASMSSRDACARARPPAATIRWRCSTRWRAATPRSCTRREAARAAARSRPSSRSSPSASTSPSCKMLGLQWRTVGHCSSWATWTPPARAWNASRPRRRARASRSTATTRRAGR